MAAVVLQETNYFLLMELIKLSSSVCAEAVQGSGSLPVYQVA